MDGLWFVAVGFFFVFVKDLIQLPLRQATLVAECNGYNKEITFVGFVDL